jgi:hypothetical protein
MRSSGDIPAPATIRAFSSLARRAMDRSSWILVFAGEAVGEDNIVAGSFTLGQWL